MSIQCNTYYAYNFHVSNLRATWSKYYNEVPHVAFFFPCKIRVLIHGTSFCTYWLLLLSYSTAAKSLFAFQWLQGAKNFPCGPASSSCKLLFIVQATWLTTGQNWCVVLSSTWTLTCTLNPGNPCYCYYNQTLNLTLTLTPGNQVCLAPIPATSVLLQFLAICMPQVALVTVYQCCSYM